MKMVIAALVPTVISVLSPLAAKGASSLAETAGQAAVQKASEILATLKRKWSTDDEASGTLRRFEENPVRYLPMFEDVLTEKVNQDKTLEIELERLLEEMGDSLTIIQRVGTVSGEATGLDAGELGRGRRVSIEQTVDDVSGKITGARIDKIG